MGRLRRLAFLAFAGVLGSIVLGIPRVMAQLPPPPGLLPAGQYFSTSSFAQLRTTTASGINLQASVSDRTSVNRPKDAPSTGGTETLLVMQAFGVNSVGGFFFEFGCYKIPASDWTIAADLSTAALNASIDGSTPTCGPPASFPTSFTVSLQWTGTGPVANNHSDTTFMCSTYTSITQRADSDNLATVSGAISAITDTVSAAHGTLRMGTIAQHVTGTVDPTCPPGAGGKGAGPGPQPAGNYEFSSVRDVAQFMSTDFNRRVFVSVLDSTVAANPMIGPSTTTETVQLFISVQDFSSFPFIFEHGCFLVSPSVLSQNGVLSAKLHADLSANPAVTPPCPNQFQPNNLPLPLTVDVSWTAVGASTSNRVSAQTSCATFTSESTSLNFGSVASDTFTLTPLFTTTFTSPDQGGLTTSEQNLHTQGVDPQACIFRG